MTRFSNKTGKTARILIVAALCCIAPLAMAQSANEVAAQQDMATMEQALTFCVLDTTYYVALENLNDTASPPNSLRPYDSIQDEGGVYTIIPDDGRFSANRRNLATAFNEWRGPYVSFQQDKTQTGTTPYDEGSPLDPWGNPYYLFNPLGLIRGDQGIITLELYGDQFDRYAIVSLGSDGVMSSDDLVREFGSGIDPTFVTSLNGAGVTLTSAPQAEPTYDVMAGSIVTLRGTNFGTPEPTKNVMFGDTVITDVSSWTSREITFEVPETLTGTHEFHLRIGTTSTNAVTATIVGSDTSVDNWAEY